MLVAGLEILIDECDEDLIRDNNWSWSGGYLQARIGGRVQKLHRMIAARLGLDLSDDIDHVNRIRTDYQRHNLRPATRSQNAMNREISSNNTSGVTGVRYDKQRNKWHARLTVESKNMWLGYHAEKDDAITARREAEIKYFGEYRRK